MHIYLTRKGESYAGEIYDRHVTIRDFLVVHGKTLSIFRNVFFHHFIGGFRNNVLHFARVGVRVRRVVDDNYNFALVDVNVDVNEDKTMRITENIYTTFQVDGLNTGFIRDIQRITQIKREVNGDIISGSNIFAPLTDLPQKLRFRDRKQRRRPPRLRRLRKLKLQNNF